MLAYSSKNDTFPKLKMCNREFECAPFTTINLFSEPESHKDPIIKYNPSPKSML